MDGRWHPFEGFVRIELGDPDEDEFVVVQTHRNNRRLLPSKYLFETEDQADAYLDSITGRNEDEDTPDEDLERELAAERAADLEFERRRGN